MSDWYCPRCQAFVDGKQVTYEETHEVCGTTVISGDTMIGDAITAADLLAKLAGFERVTFSHTAAHGPQPVFVDGIRNGKRQGWMEERSEEEHWLVNLFGEGRCVSGIGQAPTLVEALEEALRKAEER